MRVKSANAAADTPLASQTTAEDIRKKDIGSIKDLGNTTEPGVDYVDSKPGRPGGLFIRGLGGARVVTLIDNIPVPYFNNFARQGQATTTLSDTSSSFDFSSLSSVDVVRGADSSRIGSGALGGALVLRTLEPEDLIGEGKDWGGVAKTSYDSEDRSVGGSLAVAKKIENTSVLFQGSYKRGNETDNRGTADIYGTRRTKPNPADTYESNLMFKIRQDLEGGHRIGLTAERYSLRNRSDMKTLQGVSVSGSTYRIGDYRGYEDTERDRVSLDYEYEAPSTDGVIDAANLSLYWTRVGFNTGATIFFVYCIAGALAGFSGLLHSSMIWLANPRDFVGLELDVIAAVVLGGASIFGGRGTVLGTLMGVFMLVMVKNSLIIMKVDTTWQRVVVGLIIIIATAITAWRDRKSIA